MATSQSAVNVQELAKEAGISVPLRYIQVDQDPPNLSQRTHDLPTLPTIDMKKLVSGEAHADSELEKFHSAFKDWGFFQLVNHGVCSSLMEKLKYEIEEFFKLPLEEKMKYKIRAGDFEGYGTVIRSEDQILDWGDRFFLILKPHGRNPHLWADLPSSFRNTLESYFSELQKLAMQLLRFVAKALKMEVKEIEEIFENGMRAMRMTYYPPCPEPDLVMGLPPHSDTTGITILHQVNGVEGLQIRKNGVWIPVKFLPHAFVVNLGDILEILSNGMYHSIEHRATVNSEKERISIAVFFNPKFEAEVGPARSLVNVKNPPLFKRISTEMYFKELFTKRPHGKSHLQKMKIQDGESI